MYKLLLFGALLFQVSWSLSTDPVCNKGIYVLLNPLSTYAPAQTFCTKKFPIKTTTITAATVTATSTSTAPTLITSNLTEIAPTSTILTTSTVTTTTTATVQVAKRSAFAKREPNPQKAAKDAQLASQLSSLASAAAGVVSTFCSCIVTHPQTTTTPTVTATTITTPFGVSTGSGQTGVGGCNPGCFCDLRAGNPSPSPDGVCNDIPNDSDSSVCGPACTSDAGCPSGQVCIGNFNCPSSDACFDVPPCGTAASKRGLVAAREEFRAMVERRASPAIRPFRITPWEGPGA
ncbi:hypothetical protein OPT61_g7482 [Boeremia exigua]|uniref:Uncharacterized protein n=1 Tax=Boeremia exigua TaxID=749465 RepID=A0ACC2I2A7_9PLEO|nr:hypothetical protein OPT61_g7482 [Boeremia exigua]